MIADLTRPFVSVPCDKVVGIDALGFILGTAVALKLQKGFVPIRKGGKLPVPTNQVSFVYYSKQQKMLELRLGAIQTGERVLIVDEWVETGAQLNSAIQLVTEQGGVVCGLTAIKMDANAVTEQLKTDYLCHTVW